MSASESGERVAIGKASTVTIGLVLTFLGFAFWMGVQHSQLSTVSSGVDELKTSVKENLRDHEQRIRNLEIKKP
jgi:hypothetical protein